MATDSERDRLIWPDVVASTTMGDDRRYVVTAQTNNNDSTAEILIYWHIPADGGRPVLMIEVDEDTDDDSDIPLRIRRNEGLIFDGTRDETVYLKEGKDERVGGTQAGQGAGPG